MSFSRKLSYAAAALGIVAALVAGVALAGHHEDFAQTSTKWEAAYNARDAAAIAALYAEGAVAMPPNAKAQKGRAAIEAYLAKELATDPGRLQLETVEHEHSGNLGYARGTYAMLDADGKAIDRGKWVEVRKKMSGKWMIQADIWNSDMPAAE